jgi:ATP-dependent helicase/nuclease subunit B
MLQIVTSSSAAVRIHAARQFLLDSPPATDTLIVSASRGAADDFARDVARGRGGSTFGLYRFSLTQLAARLAAPRLARDRVTPTTALGMQAVAARALFDAATDRSLTYFAPVAAMPGFPRALARTLEELALAGVPASALGPLTDVGRDLANLFERFEEQFQSVSSVDRSVFLRAATRAVEDGGSAFLRCRLVLLDVALANESEEGLVSALVARAPEALATVPEGDVATLARLKSHVSGVNISDFRLQTSDVRSGGLARIRHYLFSPTPPPHGDPIEEVELFSAPGEGREAVEIARRVLHEARRGVPFDRMAIALRSPQQYVGLLEHALERAGVPAYFERGTRRPHPAGRAFLAMVACALDNLSARKFAEYLSLGQVPAFAGSAGFGPASHEGGPVSEDEVFGALADRAVERATTNEQHRPTNDPNHEPNGPDPTTNVERSETNEESDEPNRERQRSVRSPWRWERLLAESRVVATGDRWERRLHGLAHECRLQKTELERTDPDSPRIDHVQRKIDDVLGLAAFAVPVMRALAEWPVQASWTEWLDRFDQLAPRVLQWPDRVLRVLADLRPMGAIEPVTLAEAMVVLADRLGSIELDPPARRYGRVLVASPAQLRGRSFDVVFVPALAERQFPQKPREDPLLLDQARATLDAGLPLQSERAELERLHLRLAVGAAESRLYLSFPTIEIGEGRPRVPSLYALEIWRAMTGRVPDAEELQHAAARASEATLSWPAPPDRRDAIDALEHDLATLRSLAGEPDVRARGRAQYILRLNENLQRSVRDRYMRGKKAWSRWDGIVAPTDRLAPILAAHRLSARRYSLSALQKYANCPYQFLLSTIHRLRPADDLEPLHRMDPLTRGSLFHEMQTAFYRRLQDEGALPVTPAGRDRALAVLDEVVKEIADREYEELSPAVDRVWHDEIAAIRRDLRLWVDEIANAGGEWIPIKFEWAFGYSDGGALAVGRDPTSRPDPVVLDGRFQLHGAIDLVEERAATGELRVTDHKTGKYRGKDHMVVDGGKVLQPVLYSLALEEALHRPVVEGRLYYATTVGGFRDVRIPLSPAARRAGIEVLEIIDRGIENGFLAPAPSERACIWCDFLPVCGTGAEWRANRKPQEPIADLLALRRKP